MNNVNFAIPEIYGDSLSYYEVLRELIKAMDVMIDNYDTIPEQIADAVKNLDAAQLFSAVLDQLIDTIATDNTKSENAVKVYKKHDLLYATFNETVNLYESLIDFTAGTETELIVETNIREVNISELFIELRKLIEYEAQARTRGDTALQTNIDNEAQARKQADATKVNKSDVLTFEEIQASTDLAGKIASANALKSLQSKTAKKINYNSVVEPADGSFGFLICRISNNIHAILAITCFKSLGIKVVELYKTEWVTYTVENNIITFSGGDCIFIGEIY